MKRGILLALAIIVLALVPIFATVASSDDSVPLSEFEVIANAADEYLNAPTTVWNISAKNLLLRMIGGPQSIIDIRSAEDYAKGHIPGSVSVPPALLFSREVIANVPSDTQSVVSCYTGHNASQVAALLNICGYDAINHKWGIMGWTKDITVATKQFVNPIEDLPTETTLNNRTRAHDLPIVANTSSTNEAEILHAAADKYASAGFKNIKAGNLYELISDNDPSNDPQIVSVRGPEHYKKGHIPGAINIPLVDLAKIENLQKLDPERPIVVYCYTGCTGGQATAILNVLGYDASNLIWGISGWTTDKDVAPFRFNPDDGANYPLETGAGKKPSSDTGAADQPTAPSDGGGSCG